MTTPNEIKSAAPAEASDGGRCAVDAGFGLSAHAMKVSSIFGYTRTLEYVNQVRSILNAPAMSESEYKAAEDECMKAGLDLVVAAHRHAADSFFWPNTSGQTRPAEPL